MFNIKLFNKIADKGLALFTVDQYVASENIDAPDAIICRSAKLHDIDFPDSIKCVGRAGAGTNNIPVAKLTELGIPVFNAPGANANAVKELVVTGMLLASRNICQAWHYVNQLEGTDEAIATEVERGKKQYVGYELPGKTLTIIGLGNIGVQVANAARALGMRVVGYDPHITVRSAWELSSQVEQASSLSEAVAQADFISLHVPLLEETRGLFNADLFSQLKPGCVLLNFARDAVVDNHALMTALESQLQCYVCDFPTKKLINHPKVIALPHLGASTVEAEENCAVMVIDQVKQFLENGNITNAVNFPNVFKTKTAACTRLAVVNRNIPNMVAQISTALADANLNIIDLLNKSKDSIAYTLIDVEGEVNSAILSSIADIDGVVHVRQC